MRIETETQQGQERYHITYCREFRDPVDSSIVIRQGKPAHHTLEIECANIFYVAQTAMRAIRNENPLWFGLGDGARIVKVERIADGVE